MEITAENSERAGLDGWRRPSIARALCAFNARLPRRGRVFTQVRRCFIAHDGIASMADLRAYAFLGHPFQRWQCWSIKRALRKLGAVQLGRSPTGRGKPGIWALENCIAVAKQLPK